MEVYIYLIPPTLLMLAVLIALFFWALKSNQYNDIEGDSWRFLHHEERSKIDKSRKKHKD